MPKFLVQIDVKKTSGGKQRLCCFMFAETRRSRPFRTCAGTGTSRCVVGRHRESDEHEMQGSCRPNRRPMKVSMIQCTS